MSLRKNFDSFTSQHKLRDAQEEFTEVLYRFRSAEEANAPNLVVLKQGMEFGSQVRGMPPLVLLGGIDL